MIPFKVPEEHDLPPEVAAAQRQQLLSAVRRDMRRSSSSRWRRVGLSAAAAIVILLVAAPVIARWQAEPIVDDESIGCYEMLGDQSTVAIVGADGRTPEAICADQWRQGVMTSGTTAVPPLTTCVTDTGSPAVLPSSDPDVCESQGMRDLGESYTAYERERIRLRDALRERLPQDQCLALDEAEETTRDVVRELGMEGWEVSARETVMMDTPDGEVEVTPPCYVWSLGGVDNVSREVDVGPAGW